MPLVGAFVVAIGMTQYPGATLMRLGEAVAAATPDAAMVLAATALALAVASWSVPRVVAGAHGWIRSLPVDTGAHRRALATAIAVTIGPVTLLAATVLVEAIVQSGHWNGARFVALIPFSFGAAYAVLPLRRGLIAAPPAACGAAISIAGGWGYVAAGSVLVVLAEAIGGAAKPVRKGRLRGASAAWALPSRISLRALGMGIIGAWAAGAVPLLAGALFLMNNELPAPLAGRGARGAMAVALVVTLAALADRLALHRPAWPWARSLPWTSRRRAAEDAVLLALLASPVWIAGMLIDPIAALTAGAAIPLAAVRASAAMRHDGAGRATAAVGFLVEGVLASLVVALVPWLVVLAAAVTPWALRDAARREARWKVSRWTAIHHLSSGDPGSWTGR